MQNEQQLEEDQEDEEGGGFKVWLEDNLRIILSILVVFAIAGGIYSYSQRSQAPAITEETGTTSDEGSQEAKSDEQTDQNKADETGKASEEQPANTKKSDTAINPDTTKAAEAKPVETKKPAGTATESKETEKSFIETAARGDSATLLARQALANFLEKNPDSALSREHKVYIEDYLRKHTTYGHVRVGTSLEFSKSLIGEAIGKSKQLNARQLANLKKYSDRAPSLR